MSFPAIVAKCDAMLGRLEELKGILTSIRAESDPARLVSHELELQRLTGVRHECYTGYVWRLELDTLGVEIEGVCEAAEADAGR